MDIVGLSVPNVFSKNPIAFLVVAVATIASNGSTPASIQLHIAGVLGSSPEHVRTILLYTGPRMAIISS